jgi:hypothetical protein
LLIGQNECNARALDSGSKDCTPEVDEERIDEVEQNAKGKKRKQKMTKTALRTAGESEFPRTDDFVKIKELLVKLGKYDSNEPKSNVPESEPENCSKSNAYVIVVYTYVRRHFSHQPLSTAGTSNYFQLDTSRAVDAEALAETSASTEGPEIPDHQLSASTPEANPEAPSNVSTTAPEAPSDVCNTAPEAPSDVCNTAPEAPSDVCTTAPEAPSDVCTTAPKASSDVCTTTRDDLGSVDLGHTQSHVTSDGSPAGNDVDVPMQEDSTPGESSYIAFKTSSY